MLQRHYSVRTTVLAWQSMKGELAKVQKSEMIAG